MTPEEVEVLQKLWFIVDSLQDAREDLRNMVVDKDAYIEESIGIGERGGEYPRRVSQTTLKTRVLDAVISAEVALREYLKPVDAFWPEVKTTKVK